jgi:hypothetical protein
MVSAFLDEFFESNSFEPRFRAFMSKPSDDRDSFGVGRISLPEHFAGSRIRCVSGALKGSNHDAPNTQAGRHSSQDRAMAAIGVCLPEGPTVV